MLTKDVGMKGFELVMPETIGYSSVMLLTTRYELRTTIFPLPLHSNFKFERDVNRILCKEPVKLFRLAIPDD